MGVIAKCKWRGGEQKKIGILRSWHAY